MADVEHMALLRATVEADFDRAAQMTRDLEQANRWDGYETVIDTAFTVALQQQFPHGHTAADVIRLVANARLVMDPAGDTFTPWCMEVVVRGAFGERALAELYGHDVNLDVKILMVAFLANRQRLGDPDVFLQNVTQGLTQQKRKAHDEG